MQNIDEIILEVDLFLTVSYILSVNYKFKDSGILR